MELHHVGYKRELVLFEFHEPSILMLLTETKWS